MFILTGSAVPPEVDEEDDDRIPRHTGTGRIAKGIKTLEALTAKIDTTRMPPPSFRMVLVAHGEFAYRRKEDGIIVCPIGCLRP